MGKQLRVTEEFTVKLPKEYLNKMNVTSGDELSLKCDESNKICCKKI